MTANIVFWCDVLYCVSMDDKLVQRSWITSGSCLCDVKAKCASLVNPTPAQCNTAVRRLKYANSSINDMYIVQDKGFHRRHLYQELLSLISINPRRKNMSISSFTIDLQFCVKVSTSQLKCSQQQRFPV